MVLAAEATPAQPGPAAQPRQAGPQQHARPRQNGPWNNDLYLTTVTVSMVAGEPRIFVPRAGVPSIARTATGNLIAAFQWFPSDRPAAFDRVAVCFSTDEAATWTDPQPITVRDMPAGMQRPFDPTLAILPDGRIRLYFSSSRSDQKMGPGIGTWSAVSNDGVEYQFDPDPRFEVTGTPAIDCAVGLLGGTWHYFAPVQGPGAAGGYHASSADGLDFTRLPDLPSTGRDRWLGCAVTDTTGTLRFFGTGDRGLWTAVSADGSSWSGRTDIPVRGADPGAVRLNSGDWLLVYTGPPRGGLSPDDSPRATRGDRQSLKPQPGLPPPDASSPRPSDPRQ